MNYSDYKFTLDVQLHQAQISVPATLNDTARRLCIGFTDGRKPYTIADGCQATFVAKKPDGLGLFNACTIENNTVIYEFTPNTTNVIGTYECEIRLYTADGLQLTSPSFLIVVDEGVVSDDDIIDSQSEATLLNQIVSNENTRIANENERIANENERIANENKRIEAEKSKNIDARITRVEKRIENLEQGIQPSPFLTDSDVAYVKDVSPYACPYAELTEIGGMTYYDSDTSSLRNTKVTALRVHNANLFDISTSKGWESFYAGNSNVIEGNVIKTICTASARGSFLKIGTFEAGTYTITCTAIAYMADGSTVGLTTTWGTGADCANVSLKTAFVDNVTITLSDQATVWVNVTMANKYAYALTSNVAIYPGDVVQPYSEYGGYTDTPILEAVTELDGYGMGVSGTYCNKVIWDVDNGVKKYIQQVGIITLTGKEGWYDTGELDGIAPILACPIGAAPGTTPTVWSVYTSAGVHDCKDGNLRMSGYNTHSLAGDTSVVSWVNHLSYMYAMGTPVKVVYVLETPIVTDISNLLNDDNLIKVEAAGKITFVNQHANAVHSVITYQLNENGVEE